MVNDLKKQLENEIEKRKDIVKNTPGPGDPTKLEQLQAEALLEKAKQSPLSFCMLITHMICLLC